MDINTVLPQNSGIFSKALAAAASDDLPVPYQTILNPYQTPSEFLPFLAHNHGVDLWFEDWVETKKREMIAQCAGHSMQYPGEQLADLKGTLKGLKRYLEFVDADIISRISYPDHFIFDRGGIGKTPIAHPPFKSRYLIRVNIPRPFNVFEIGRSFLNNMVLRDVSIKVVKRAKLAAKIAKFEHMELTVSFSHKREIRLSDKISPAIEKPVQGYLDRQYL